MNHPESQKERALPTRLIAYVDVESLSQVLRQYYELIKPRIALLIVISTSVGYSYGVGHFSVITFFHTLLGTALMAAGSATLNQWYERDLDALMHRTKRRPIPAGTIAPVDALIFGVVVSVIGVLELLFFVNVLAAGLGLLTSVGYLFAYTPLKRIGPICTTIGAFPGAMPPLIGYAAATGHLTIQAWILFAILFLWQFPHFHAIAWMYREEYDKAGIKMLAVVRPFGNALRIEIMCALILLIPATLAPTFLHMAGKLYFGAAVVLNLAFLYFGVRMSRQHDDVRARQLLLASVIYMPLLFAFLVIDNPKFAAIFY